MSVSELWERALTIDDYVGQMWRKHRKSFIRNRDRSVIDVASRARFAARPLHILIMTEPYCEDSAQLVPVVWRLADEIDDVALRILRQHEHLDLASHYLVDGHPAIPVFILLDEQLDEIGALVERPARMTQETTAEIRRFQQAHPDLPGITRTLERMPEATRDAVKQHLVNWRNDQFARWADYLLDDLATLVIGSAP
jgi:hypothetical protein